MNTLSHSFRAVLTCSAVLGLLLLLMMVGTEALAQNLEGLKLEKDAKSLGDVESFTFSYKDKKEQEPIKGILLKPAGKGPFPAVVVNHGGGGSARAFGLPNGIILAKAGYVAIACDYTHSIYKRAKVDPANTTPNTVWNNAENRRRALACIEILQSLPEVDQRKIAMYGNSMGAMLTIVMCQETDKIKAAAITAGGVGGGVRAPVEGVARIKIPFMILHGEQDALVPPEHPRTLKELLDKQGTVAELKMFPGVGHDLVRVKSDEVFALITAFFAKQLGVKAAATTASP